MVAVSIVAHPSGDAAAHARFLDECLESLRESTRAVPYRVILTNNLGQVDLFGRMRSLTGGELLVTNQAPLGFAANHNRVVRDAPEPYVFILNDDTLILDGAVDRLARALDEDPHAAAVGPRMFCDRSLQQQLATAGTRVMTPERALLWRIIRETPLIGCERLTPVYAELKRDPGRAPLLHLQGAAFMVRRSAYLHVGGMDEGYGMYREETDLCLAFRKHGWSILYCPEASIVHWGGASTTGSVYREQYQASLNRFLRKHFPVRTALFTGLIQPPCLLAVRLLRRLWQQAGKRRSAA